MDSVSSENLEFSDREDHETGKTDEGTPLLSSNSSGGKPLRLRNKIAYGIGGMPFQLTNTVIGFYIAIFLLNTANLPPTYTSVIIFFGRFWDAVTDPLVGLVISKTNTRFGKLKPWMAGAAPTAALCYLMLWSVPNISSTGAFFWYFSFYCGFQMVLTGYHLPYTALTMLISMKQHERDSATAFRIASEVAGNLLGNIIMGGSILIFTRDVKGQDCKMGNETESSNFTEALRQEKLGYQVGAATIGCVILISAVTVLFGTTELKSTHEDKNDIPLKKAVPRILSFKPYLMLLGIFVSFMTAMQSIQGNFALFCKYTLHIDYYQYIIVVILASAFLSMPVWHYILKRIGKKKTMAIGASTTIPLLLVYAFTPPDYQWPVYVSGVIVGNAIAVMQLVPWSMVPDVIDDFILQYDHSSETIFYSFFVMFVKFATAISLSMSTLILGIVGYENEYCVQPEAVALALRLLVTAFPCLCVALGYVFLYFYPITEEVRQQNKTTLEEWRNGRDEVRRNSVKLSEEQRQHLRSLRTPSSTLL